LFVASLGAAASLGAHALRRRRRQGGGSRPVLERPCPAGRDQRIAGVSSSRRSATEVAALLD
jgi:hypothetical protein